MPPEAVPINASIASTGKGIRYIGQHCYGFSGSIALANNSVDQFNFTSGAGYIEAVYIFGLNNAGISDGKRIGFKIFFNSVQIMDVQTVLDQGGSRDLDITTPVYFLIPPFTEVIIQGTTSDAGVTCFGMFSGRVYGED